MKEQAEGAMLLAQLMMRRAEEMWGSQHHQARQDSLFPFDKVDPCEAFLSRLTRWCGLAYDLCWWHSCEGGNVSTEGQGQKGLRAG